MAVMKNLSLKQWLKDPLLAFLIGSVLIFIVVFAYQDDADLNDDPKRIVVDRETLLMQIQYMTKNFNPEVAAMQLDNLSEEGLQRLINKYVGEEALYRESVQLGFGDNDYIIKKRMIQKLDFMADGLAKSTVKISDEDISTYYDENIEHFANPATLTFAHVFIKHDNRQVEQVNELINELANQLNQDKAGFKDAINYGERFPFDQEFTDLPEQEVAVYFGEDMAKSLFSLNADATQWYGPFTSKYGQHMVLIKQKVDAKPKPLSEVKKQVYNEILHERKADERKILVDDIIDSYTVERVEPLITPAKAD